MKALFTLISFILITSSLFAQSGPELTFTNPVLISGVANKQGALYRFSNVAPGVDAEVKLKKFSRPDIVMSTVDNGSLGWNKAFQPEFGLPGLVLPFQHWYVDFEMTFYEAGKTKRQMMDTIDLTALDVDGDGNSIREYITYDNPNSIAYSTVSFLTNAVTGVLGQVHECGEDNLFSILISCTDCGGDGITNSGSGNNNTCVDCDGSGKKHLLCGHAYQGGTGCTVTGPVNNFSAIDTNAIQVMATYQFLNKDRVKFRYGGKSGALSSNGSGIRLNSTWFREFSLAPMSILPVKMESFTATLDHDKKANLEWITATEINVSHYIVEKSTDGNTYKEAGLIFANGNTNSKSVYRFADPLSAELSPVIYYRIRSVDVDSKMQYSATRVIKLDGKTGTSVQITSYPNPVRTDLHITMPAAWQNKKATVELYASNGRLAVSMQITSCSQTETIITNRLAPGMYVVRVSCNGETAQQKIIKQ